MKGKYDCWNTLVMRLHVYCGLDQYSNDYSRLTILAEKLRTVIPSKDNYRTKYGELLSLLDPYLITDKGDVTQCDWDGDEDILEGSESRSAESRSPIISLVASLLAAWNIPIKELVKIENEFIKIQRDLKPKTFAEKRYIWHDLVTRATTGTGMQNTGMQINAVAEAKNEGWENIEEDDFDDTAIEVFDSILAIRKQRFGEKRFLTRRGNHFDRVRAGLMGPKRTFNNAPPKKRTFGYKGQQGDDCRRCKRDYPNQPAHKYANCPRAKSAQVHINQVGEEDDMNARAEAIREQMAEVNI
mgnify:CR=1 FL=1